MGARVRIAAGLAAVALGVVAWSSGAGELFEVERFVELLRDMGVWAPVLYVLLFSLLEPFGVLGIVFVVPGSLVWDWPQLFALSWLGAVGAGAVGFTFARTIGRDFVARHLPDGLRRYDERLARHGLRTTILIRLLFFITPPSHWVLGLSPVGFGTFVLGTAIGFLPGMALFTLAGEGIAEAIQALPTWVSVVAGALLIVTVVVLRQRRRREEAASH